MTIKGLGPGSGGLNINPDPYLDDIDGDDDLTLQGQAPLPTAKPAGPRARTSALDADGVGVRNESLFSGTPAEQAAAREKLAASTLPEVLQIVEQNFGIQIDASKLFKLQNKILQDPNFKPTVRALKVEVERWSHEALRSLEASPPMIRLPDLSQLPSARETTQLQQSEDADDIDEIDLAPPTKPLDPALQMAADYRALCQNWPSDPNDRKLTPEQKFLVSIMPPPTTPLAPGEEARFDTHGNQIVGQEFYTRLDKVVAKFGPSEAQVAAYNALLFQMQQPVDMSESKQAQQSADGDDDGDATIDGVTPSQPSPLPQGVPPPPMNENAQRAFTSTAGGTSSTESIGRPSGASPARTVTLSANDAMAGLALLGDNADITIVAMMVLMQTMSSMNRDIKDRMQLARVQHKMNDAMRKHMADLMHQMSGLRPSKNSDMPPGMFVQNMKPIAVYGPDGKLTGEVEMVPTEYESPIADHTGGSPTPHTTSALQQIRDMTGKMGDKPYKLRPPDALSGATENGTIYITSSYMWVTVDHASVEKDRMRTELETLKLEMDKSMLSIQRVSSQRKAVFDNLNKVIKSKSDEWGKSVALLKR